MRGGRNFKQPPRIPRFLLPHGSTSIETLYVGVACMHGRTIATGRSLAIGPRGRPFPIHRVDAGQRDLELHDTPLTTAWGRPDRPQTTVQFVGSTVERRRGAVLVPRHRVRQRGPGARSTRVEQGIPCDPRVLALYGFHVRSIARPRRFDTSTAASRSRWPPRSDVERRCRFRPRCVGKSVPVPFSLPGVVMDPELSTFRARQRAAGAL